MKISPVDFSDCELMPIQPLLGADLIACDHCGIVAVDTPRFGWQRWTDEHGAQRHHCASAAEYNEWVRNSLVHNVAPESAIEYEQWDDHPTDEQPEQIPAVMSEAIDVAEGATEFASERGLFEKAHDEQTEAEFLGYAQTPISEEAEKPTAATDADFAQGPQGDWRTRTTGEYEHLEHMTVAPNPIFPPASTIDLGDDPDGDLDEQADIAVAQGDSAIAGAMHEAEEWTQREREDYGPNGPGGHI